MELARLPNEDYFKHKVRLCRAKEHGELPQVSWKKIVDILGEDISPDTLRKASKGLIEYDDYLNSVKHNDTAILSISDLHIPFQLDYHILDEYKERVDILVLNGDISDMQAISKFSKAYRISPMEEIIKTREYLISLIEFLKPKQTVINYGNHDVRFERYLSKNLDTDLIELMPRTQLELIILDGFNHFDKRAGTKIWYQPLRDLFSDCDIKYTNNWWCQIGDAIFCHPTACSSGILKTSEKAMTWFKKEGCTFNNLSTTHTHHSGQYTIGNTTIYEQGAFCDVAANNYSDGRLSNSQKEGYIILYQDGDGVTIKDKTKLKVLN